MVHNFKKVTNIKDLKIYFCSILSFEHHVDITTERALKVVGIIKQNT